MDESILQFINSFLKISRDELMKGLDRKDIWSSLLWMEIVFSLEEEYDIQFREDELKELMTPRKLCLAAEREIHLKNG